MKLFFRFSCFGGLCIIFGYFSFSDCAVSELIPLAKHQPDVVESARSYSHINHLYVPSIVHHGRSGSSVEVESINFPERQSDSKLDDIVCISNVTQ